MLKAVKAGGSPGPSGSKPVQATALLLLSPHGHRKETVHTSTPSHQLRKQCPRTSPSTPTRAQHFQPALHEVRFCSCLDFSQPSALIPPPRALTVHQPWVSGWLLISRDLGFPMQRQLPGLPFLEIPPDE